MFGDLQSNMAGYYQTEKYDHYQKECQTVLIRSKESSISISLANLFPNFLNLGTQQRHCYYQLRSVQMPNSFQNTFDNDAVQFVFSAILNCQNVLTNSGQTTSFRYFFKIVTDEPIKFGKDSFANAIEMCDQWNQQVLKTSLEFQKDVLARRNESIVTREPMTFDEVFWTAFMPNCKIEFDPATQKFSIKYTPVVSSPLFSPQFDVNGTTVILQDGSMDQCTFEDSKLQVIISPLTSSSQRRKRLAKMLGFSQYGQCIVGTDSGGQAIQQNAYYEDFNFDLLTFKDLSSDSIGGAFYNNQNTSSMRVLAKKHMNANMHDAIHVHSSLNSPYWLPNGERSDLLEIIPIKDPIGYVPQETILQGKIYQVKETPDGIRAFSVYFTDKDGVTVNFDQEYVLRISFFFKE